MLIFRLVIQMTTITFIVKHILYMYIHRDTQNISWNKSSIECFVISPV